MKLKLQNVTLLGIDCVNVPRLQEAMDVSEKEIEFASSKLLTSLPSDDPRRVEIRNLNTIELFSEFCIKDLHMYVDTDFVLTVQHDGFILNPQNWNNDFLKYDYIGAPFFIDSKFIQKFDLPEELLGNCIVGNGGFSLRSKKFLEVAAKLYTEGKILRLNPQDVAQCIWYRDLFEKEGIVFAPVEIALQFSIEGEKNLTFKDQFGFHGFGWTNIDLWIDTHPEYSIIVSDYKKARVK
jgi:hypothetical protein